MEFMRSDQEVEKIYDEQRKIWVKALPEEEVRQNMVRWLIEEGGYPKDLIVIEKAISQLPHLIYSKQSCPVRRLDIVCYAKDLHQELSLYPLLLIECKSTALNSVAHKQLLGYNMYVKSYFVACTNGYQSYTGFYDNEKQDYVFISAIPLFQDLISMLQE